MRLKNEIATRLISDTRKKKNSFLDAFAEKSLNKNTSLFIGSGVSRNSGHVTWGELFEPLARELKIQITENTDLYKLAQYYENKHSESELRKKINDKINQIKPGNRLLSQLIDIDFNNVWTTNYDNLIEQELSQRLTPHNVIHNEKNLININNDRVNIYKLNGDISDLEKMIITKNDYDHYKDNHPLFLTFLKKELISNHFLFVGYSFADELVLDCLNSINRLLGKLGNTHYAIMVVGEDTTIEFEHKIKDLKRRYNIESICVTKDEIVNLIKNLNTRIKEKKVFISGAYDQIPDEAVTKSDQLSYALVNSLFQQGYRISTGVGKRLGTLITGYSYQYLKKEGVQNKDKYISMRPFPFHLDLSEKKKREYRDYMQYDCNAAIFLFGQSKTTHDKGSFEKTGHYSEGVYQEFLIAKRDKRIIIPIGSTGYEAEVIWNEINSNINHFPYLHGKMDLLRKEEDPKKLSDIILHILNEAADNNRVN